MSPEPFDSRAKALPAKRSEKGYGKKCTPFESPLVKKPSWRRLNTLGQKKYWVGEVEENCLIKVNE